MLILRYLKSVSAASMGAHVPTDSPLVLLLALPEHQDGCSLVVFGEPASPTGWGLRAVPLEEV